MDLEKGGESLLGLIGEEDAEREREMTNTLFANPSISYVQSLKASFESLSHDLRKVHEVYHHRRGGTDLSLERMMADLTISIVEYVSARKDMIDLYPVLNSMELFLTG